MLSRFHFRALILPMLTMALLGFVFLGDSAVAKPKHTKRHTNWGDIYLGVYSQSVDKELATSFKLSVDRGAIVNEVEPDSPADIAGIKEDDVITSVNGHEIYDEDDLVDEIQAFDVGDRVKIGLVRDGKPMTIEAELDERNDDSMPSLRGLARLDELRALAHPNIAIPGGHHAPRAYAWNGDRIRELSDRGYIGISYTDLTTQLAAHYGLTGSGALVTEVVKRTPAEKAGLKAGDIVTKVDDEAITRRNSLGELIGDYHPGDTATLTIVRDKKTITLPVVVDERDDEDRIGMFPGSLNNTLRGASRQRALAMRELEAARKDLNRTRGLRYGDDSDLFDADEYKAEMDQLKRELEALQLELKELRR